MTDEEIATSLESNAAYARGDLARAIMLEAARRLRGPPLPVHAKPNNHPGTGGFLTLPADYLDEDVER